MKRICFIGIAGSGKTEHLLLLKKELEGMGLRCRYTNLRGLYFRFFSLPLLFLLNRIHRIHDHTRYPNVGDLHDSIIKIWVFLFFLDIWTLAIIRGYFFDASDMLLSDRGIIDSTVDLMIHLGDRNLYKHWISKLFLVLLKTDVVLLLDIDSETACNRRKDTEDVHKLDLRRKTYLEISEEFEIPMISTERSFDDVHVDIKKALRRRGVTI